MTPLKGHHTVYSDEHPNLYAVLAAEPSPRRRARLLVWMAEQGCQPKSQGVLLTPGAVPTHLTGTVPPSDPITQETPLDEDFITSILGGYMRSDLDEATGEER
ncbi:hypothetical protein PEP31012_01838 [Pandoraea eparura]|uniref:Uncharacterized protein n=1 Tax=Pandoraea eparura TaxID=2508291 RepID=A0A5E4U7A5_9BURK|nr:hypothetical protein PEP31012_01838 [Pandoraea eparura]